MHINPEDLAAELLQIQARNISDGKKNLKNSNSQSQKFELEFKLECEALYYWILRRLEDEVYAQRSETVVTISVDGSINEFNKVFLEVGIRASYIPYYIKGEKFFTVIEETVKCLNQKRNYQASYVQTSPYSCEFQVSLSVKR